MTRQWEQLAIGTGEALEHALTEQVWGRTLMLLLFAIRSNAMNRKPDVDAPDMRADAYALQMARYEGMQDATNQIITDIRDLIAQLREGQVPNVLKMAIEPDAKGKIHEGIRKGHF